MISGKMVIVREGRKGVGYRNEPVRTGVSLCSHLFNVHYDGTELYLQDEVETVVPFFYLVL